MVPIERRYFGFIAERVFSLESRERNRGLKRALLIFSERGGGFGYLGMSQSCMLFGGTGVGVFFKIYLKIIYTNVKYYLIYGYLKKI